MCFIMSVELLNMPKRETEILANQVSSSSALLHVKGSTSLFGRGNLRLGISEEGGCACSMLTDEADWNAAFWDIQPEMLPHLADVLSFIAERVVGSFAFEDLWVGEKPKETVEVSPDDLKDAVLKNRIGTKVRYVVSGRAPLSQN